MSVVCQRHLHKIVVIDYPGISFRMEEFGEGLEDNPTFASHWKFGYGSAHIFLSEGRDLLCDSLFDLASSCYSMMMRSVQAVSLLVSSGL